MGDESAEDAKRTAASGLWRVTRTCKEQIGYAASLGEAEALEREHRAVSTSVRRHVITIARK